MKGKNVIKPINVFISYRRKDSKANARSLYQALKDDFEVFFDIDKNDSISYGQDFPERIKYGIEKSDIFIPIIGQEFSSELNNRKEIHDWVREEIKYAKKLNKIFLPIFIDDASMPKVEELFDELRFICKIDSFTLSHDKFSQDIRTIKRSIRSLIFEVDEKKTKSKISNSQIFSDLTLLLKEFRWEEASRETINLLLKISKREKYGWLRIKDIEELSCDVICTINQLWKKYSRDNFSFCKQLALLEENEITLDKPSAFIEFSELVLWKDGAKWEYQGKEEISGSFPLPICFSSKLSINRDSFIPLVSKLKTCSEF